MRGLTMTKRSVYHLIECEKCAKTIRNGEPFLGTTLYVDVARRESRHFTRGTQDVVIRLAWHRRCMDEILTNTPTDPFTVEAQRRFEEYRQDLMTAFADG